MQDPTLDTQWNDALREKGIIPRKEEKEISENELIDIVENTVQQKLDVGKKQIEDYSLEELDLVEDEEDERVLLEYRQKRLAEIKAQATKAKYGDVREISADDYVEHVNKAGNDVWVVLHLYKQGVPLCSVINNYIQLLAAKFPAVKFLKSVSDTCIPNFPDKNLPTIFIYFEGQMKQKFVGVNEIGGMNITCDELEWTLSEVGALKTDLDENPRKKINDVLLTQLKENDCDDW